MFHIISLEQYFRSKKFENFCCALSYNYLRTDPKTETTEHTFFFLTMLLVHASCHAEMCVIFWQEWSIDKKFWKMIECNRRGCMYICMWVWESSNSELSIRLLMAYIHFLCAQEIFGLCLARILPPPLHYPASKNEKVQIHIYACAYTHKLASEPDKVKGCLCRFS